MPDPVQKQQPGEHSDERAQVPDAHPEASDDAPRLWRAHHRERRVVEDQARLEKVVRDHEQDERHHQAARAQCRGEPDADEREHQEERKTTSRLVRESAEDGGAYEDEDHRHAVDIAPRRVRTTHIDDPERQVQRHDVHREDRVGQIVECPGHDRLGQYGAREAQAFGRLRGDPHFRRHQYRYPSPIYIGMPASSDRPMSTATMKFSPMPNRTPPPKPRWRSASSWSSWTSPSHTRP